MKWYEVVDQISPYIVKIESPAGHGTGFLCLINETKTLCGIATAHHVVRYADEWQQPIRIRHHTSNKTVLFKETERSILGNPETDSAVILLPHGVLDFPETLIPLLPSDKYLKIGGEVGWLGFPALEPHTLCFFSGVISAWQQTRHAYLIDGVAINGVSGGPVVHIGPGDKPRIIGAVSAYIANRATGDTLPGLAYAQDVSHFHDTANRLKTMDEAIEKKKQLEEAAASQLPQDAPPGLVPEEPTPETPAVPDP